MTEIIVGILAAWWIGGIFLKEYLRHKQRKMAADIKSFLLLREKIDSTMNYFANMNFYSPIKHSEMSKIFEFIECTVPGHEIVFIDNKIQKKYQLFVEQVNLLRGELIQTDTWKWDAEMVTYVWTYWCDDLVNDCTRTNQRAQDAYRAFLLLCKSRLGV